MKKRRRCFGLTLRRRRCGRFVEGWFCADHRWQPVAWLLSAFAALVLAFGPDLFFSRDQEIISEQKATRADIAEVKTLLERKAVLKPGVIERDLELDGFLTRYDLGFALLFTDGRRTLHFGRPSPDVFFYPDEVRVTEIRADALCFLPGSFIAGPLLWQRMTFCLPRKPGWRQVFFADDALRIVGEVFADGPEGVAWIFGIQSAPPK